MAKKRPDPFPPNDLGAQQTAQVQPALHPLLSKSVADLSAEQLNEIAAMVQQEKKERREREIEAKQAESLKNLERLQSTNILDLMQHSCTSCSDSNPCNGYSTERGYARCTKCHLIEILESLDNRFEVRINAEITLIC